MTIDFEALVRKILLLDSYASLDGSDLTLDGHVTLDEDEVAWVGAFYEDRNNRADAAKAAAAERMLPKVTAYLSEHGWTGHDALLAAIGEAHPQPGYDDEDNPEDPYYAVTFALYDLLGPTSGQGPLVRQRMGPDSEWHYNLRGRA